MSIQALAQHDRNRWQAVATKAQKKLETRLFIDGKPIFYEMMWMLEREGSLILRLKHFSPELVGWEEKDKTVDFKFVDRVGDRMRFSGLTFEKVGDTALNIYLALKQKDGLVKEEVFRMERAK